MRGRLRIGTALVAVSLVASGCYGPFNLTRRLYNWNGQIHQGKWEKEFMFLILAWVPVYGLAVAGDALIFNSMEFWTGNNPVDPPSKASLPTTKRFASGDTEALVTYARTSEGGRMLIEQFRQGVPLGTLRVEPRDGMLVGVDEQGRTLVTAQTLPDGGVLVRDGQGAQLASYSGPEVQQQLERIRP
jgi:hypothetical protein